MDTTTATAVEMQQFLSHDSTINLSESSFEFFSDMEFDLESILVKEFALGLPSDLESPY
jgi:hypothetical protein